MLGHQNKIKIRRICTRDQLVKRAGAVAAEMGVSVDHTFVLVELGILVYLTTLVGNCDLFGDLSELITSINERYLYRNENGKTSDKNLFYISQVGYRERSTTRYRRWF